MPTARPIAVHSFAAAFFVSVVSTYATATSGAASNASQTGLVSHWKANGNTTDELGVNNGSPVGSVAYAPGAVGQAFAFTGAEYVNVPSPNHQLYANGFTVAAWISIAANDGVAGPVLNYRTPLNDMGFTLEKTFGVPGSMLLAVNQTGVAEDFEIVMAAGWQTNTLYHIAATFDPSAGTMTIYRNGKAVASRNDVPALPMAIKASPQMHIGHNIVASNSYWNGLIDDVQFYGHPLSATEVGALAGGSTLVSHWKFDELEGTFANDTTGAFPGTLSGGAAFVAGGISGNAVSLSEATNSVVNMGTSFPGFTSGDFTVVAWVKTSTNHTGSFVVTKHTGGSFNGYIVNVNQMGTFDDYGAPNKVLFYGSGMPGQELTSTTSVNDDSWHQIVGVYRAGGMSAIYVDGAPAELTKAAQTMVANTAPFLVGGFSNAGTPTGTYTGLVDDVQVYSSALSDAQIQYLYNHPGRVAPSVMFDLGSDWSDTENPNGTWQYREGTNALPHVNAWGDVFGDEFVGDQPAWARTGGGNTFLPGWFKSSVPLVDPMQYDFKSGDIVTHSTDDGNGAGSGAANVLWTSPFTGVVDVSGSVWMTRNIGRSNDWFLYHNSTLLTQGNIASGDPFDRATPMSFSAGGGGASVLRDITIAAGDTIRLEFVKTSQFGDAIGVNLSMSVAVPEQATIVTNFVPKTVKLKLAGAGKDSLSVAGTFDDGGATVDYSLPVTLQLGGFSQEFTLVPNATGTTLAFKDTNLSVTVKPNLKGSSRNSITIKLAKTSLTGLVDPNSEIELHLRGVGLPDARGIVRLTNGSFTLGKNPGTLIAPDYFPNKLSATVSDSKPDVLSLSSGFATDGSIPDSLFGIHVAVGTELQLAIPGSAFTKKGSTFKAAGVSGNGTYSIALDFVKQLVTVKTKGIELGDLGGSTTTILGDSFTGPLEVGVPVRLGVSGTKKVY
ncbi:MAG: LamG domain-containing protein [Planctomycetota bacterium]